MLHDLSWHGRRFTVAIGPRSTTVTLTGGAALPLKTGDRLRRISTGRMLTVGTRRPDHAVTDDVALCGGARATSSQPGAPALAAVDGSPATDWQPVNLPSTLTLSLRGGTPHSEHSDPAMGPDMAIGAGSPTFHQPPGPVSRSGRAPTASPSPSTVIPGARWRRVTGRTTGATDVVRFPATPARYVAVHITASTAMQQPMLDELTVTR